MTIRQTFRVLAITALALVAASCAETTKIDAAGDVHAFLVAIRDSDRAAFDAHVDRDALKIQIRSRIMAEAAKRDDKNGELIAMAAMLGRPVLDKLSDAMISQALQPVDSDHVCVVTKRDGPCLLDFRNEDGVWKLIGFEGDMSTLKSPKMKLGF